MTIENSSTEKQQITAKKPYEKPSFRFEKVFVTSALSCGKLSGGGGGCTLKTKFS